MFLENLKEMKKKKKKFGKPDHEIPSSHCAQKKLNLRNKIVDSKIYTFSFL
jgi:hypothetical protein